VREEVSLKSFTGGAKVNSVDTLQVQRKSL